MGRSAGQAARVEGVDRPVVAPRAKAVPRPAEVTSLQHTVREILPPWHLIEARVKASAKAKAPPLAKAPEPVDAQWLPADAVEEMEELEVEPAPPSGVRVSDPRLGVATPVLDSLLTFKAYTLAELESRDGPASQARFDSTRARRHARSMRWKNVATTLRAFALATLAWWRLKPREGFRPSPKIALREPFDALGDALQVAVEAVDWRKHGVTTGIAIGATFTLLFGVLTAAELTDDLKPGSSPHLATTEIAAPRIPVSALAGKPVAAASNMAAMGVQPVPSPAVVIDADADAEPEPAPVPAKRASAKKPKPKSNRLTFRNPDAVFNP